MIEILWENITVEELFALGMMYDVVVDGDKKVVRLELISRG